MRISKAEASDQTAYSDSAIEAFRTPRRDRIVILGRTQAGKTLFVSVLYYLLWKEGRRLTVRALDGPTHKACMDVVNTLKSGRWPSATSGSRYLDLEVSLDGRSRPLVCLDYPGEVFRKAFIDNATTPDVEDLLDHIDRAVGVIALVDPAVVAGKNLDGAMDDEFGILKAIERIRSRPDASKIPVALVLTKNDIRKDLIASKGGLEAFVKRYYSPLIRSMRSVKAFACAAVQEVRAESRLEAVPEILTWNLAAPLLYIITELDRQERDECALQQRQANMKLLQARADAENRRQIRHIILVGSGCAVAILVLGLLAVVSWRLGQA